MLFSFQNEKWVLSEGGYLEKMEKLWESTTKGGVEGNRWWRLQIPNAVSDIGFFFEKKNEETFLFFQTLWYLPLSRALSSTLLPAGPIKESADGTNEG